MPERSTREKCPAPGRVARQCRNTKNQDAMAVVAVADSSARPLLSPRESQPFQVLPTRVT